MSGGCLATIYRFYSFSDSSGNQADFEVFVSLFDNESPYIIQGPSDLTLDCSNSLYYQEALDWFESGDIAARLLPMLFEPMRRF